MFQLFHSTLLDSDRAARGRLLFFFRQNGPATAAPFQEGRFWSIVVCQKKGKTQKGGKHFLFSRIVSAFSIQLCWGATARRGVVRCSKKKNTCIVPGTSNGFLDSPAGV